MWLNLRVVHNTSFVLMRIEASGNNFMITNTNYVNCEPEETNDTHNDAFKFVS